MEHLLTSESIISFLILVVLEVVLGIDNVIFVSLILNRMEEKNKKKARRAWMITGIIIRSGLLMGLSWLLSQKRKIPFPCFWKRIRPGQYCNDCRWFVFDL